MKNKNFITLDNETQNTTHPDTPEQTIAQIKQKTKKQKKKKQKKQNKINIELIEKIITEKKTIIPSLRNRDWKKWM